MHREPEVLEARVPVVECLDVLARITSKELAPTSFCEKWHPPECLFYKSENECKLGDKSSCTHRQVAELPRKRSKTMVTKVQWLCAEKYTTIGLRIQDMEPPKSLSILRKSSNIRKPIRCVKFTKAIARHTTKIRDQNPSLGLICPGEPHQRSPNVAPTLQILRIGRDRVARARCPRSSGEAGQKC